MLGASLLGNRCSFSVRRSSFGGVRGHHGRVLIERATHPVLPDDGRKQCCAGQHDQHDDRSGATFRSRCTDDGEQPRILWSGSRARNTREPLHRCVQGFDRFYRRSAAGTLRDMCSLGFAQAFDPIHFEDAGDRFARHDQRSVRPLTTPARSPESRACSSTSIPLGADSTMRPTSFGP